MEDPAGNSALPSEWRGEAHQAPRGGLRIINSFLDVLYVSAQRPRHSAPGESHKTKELFGTGCSFWRSEKQIAVTAGDSSSERRFGLFLAVFCGPTVHWWVESVTDHDGMAAAGRCP